MTKFFLSIDNGGTNTKAVIFDEKGVQIAVSSFPTEKIEEQDGFREVDLTDLWDSLCCSINKVLDKASLSAQDIVAVSCVGHGKGLYLLDKNMQVFRNGILSTDERALKETAFFGQRIDVIWKKTRQQVMAAQSPVLLCWLKQNEPDTYKQIGWILSAKDFIRFKLTGQISQEIGDASGNNLIDLNTQKYDQSILDFFEISEMSTALPKLIDSTTIAGNVSAEAAEESGLAAGTPVVGGLFDIDACTLGAGVLDNSYLNIVAGTWNINVYPTPEFSGRNNGLMNSIFPTGEFLVEASSPTSAANLDIILNTLMEGLREELQELGISIYAVMEAFLQKDHIAASKLLFFPYLYGSQTGKKAQGCFLGMTSTTTKPEMIRAVYEGIVLAHRYHIEQLMKGLKKFPAEVRISGGAANSQAWMQMFADVLGLTVETVKATEIGGLGGAIAAAVGIGEYPSLEIAVANMVTVEKRFQPDFQKKAIYDVKYETFKKLLVEMLPVWQEIEKMQEKMG